MWLQEESAKDKDFEFTSLYKISTRKKFNIPKALSKISSNTFKIHWVFTGFFINPYQN
jgi:hypothetical protein